MNWWSVFPFVCGYECVGDQVRLYVDGPTPTPSFSRQQGVRSPLFRLYSGQDAESILTWLAQNRVWQVLRVPPPFGSERGVRAILAASDWNCGEGSALSRFACSRMIDSEAHRERLRREVNLLIGSVLENPVRIGELQELQAIEDVVNAAPTGVELASTAELVNAYFGSAG
jgi:hypothetical protein